jgi:hypothetical protein
MTVQKRIENPALAGFTTELPDRADAGEIERLFAALDQVTWADNPRTARLLASGLRKKSQKIVEEAAEVALETVRSRTDVAPRSCRSDLAERPDCPDPITSIATKPFKNGLWHVGYVSNWPSNRSSWLRSLPRCSTAPISVTSTERLARSAKATRPSEKPGVAGWQP